MKQVLVALAVTLTVALGLYAQGPAQIYTRPAVPPREALERLNLRMAWRIYVPVVGRRDGIRHVVILHDQVLVLTRYGVVLSLDPLTGEVDWRTFVGEPFGVTLPLEVDADHVYVVNYGQRYKLLRTTGELVPGGTTRMEHAGLVTTGEGLQTHHQDTIYTVRLDRSLTAEAADGGYLLWRLSLPGRVLRFPDVTDADVFIAPEGVGLQRLHRRTGELVWTNSEAMRFLAVNPKFVYATDRTGRLLVLDYARGTRLSVYDTREFVVPINNEMSDRVFLASHDGLLVCLHDRDYPRPLRNKSVDFPDRIFKRRPELESPGKGDMPAKVRAEKEPPKEVRSEERRPK